MNSRGWHFWDDACREGLAEPTELGGPYTRPVKDWPGFPKRPDIKEARAEIPPLVRVMQHMDAATKNILAVLNDSLDAADVADLKLGTKGLDLAVERLREFIEELEADDCSAR